MRITIAAVLAAAMLTLTACGDSDNSGAEMPWGRDESSKTKSTQSEAESSAAESKITDSSDAETPWGKAENSSSESEIDGTYLSFDGLIYNNDFGLSADELINKAKTQYINLQMRTKSPKELADAEAGLIKLENGRFSCLFSKSNMNKCELSGSFKLDDDKVKFNYEKYVVTTYGNQGAGFGTLIKDKSEAYNDPKINEFQAGTDDDAGKALDALNVSETYFKLIGPGKYYRAGPMEFNARRIPPATGFVPSLDLLELAMSGAKFASAELLEKHGDFLCGDTVGWTIDGVYESGKSFTVSLDPQAILDDCDPVFSDKEHFSYLLESGAKGLGSTEMTKVEFSDGKWKWISSEGKTLSTGTYSESSIHKGFIVITAANGEENRLSGNEYLFIDDSGIYYPTAVKIE